SIPHGRHGQPAVRERCPWPGPAREDDLVAERGALGPRVLPRDDASSRRDGWPAIRHAEAVADLGHCPLDGAGHAVAEVRRRHRTACWVAGNADHTAFA